MMTPDNEKEWRAIKIVFLLLAGAGCIAFPLFLLPEVYTVIYVAVVTPVGLFVRWRWGEKIDRWLLGG